MGVGTSPPLSITRQKEGWEGQILSEPTQQNEWWSQDPNSDLLDYSSGCFHCICSSLWVPWILDNDGCGKQPGLVGTAQPWSWIPGSHVLPVNWWPGTWYFYPLALSFPRSNNKTTSPGGLQGQWGYQGEEDNTEHLLLMTRLSSKIKNHEMILLLLPIACGSLTAVSWLSVRPGKSFLPQFLKYLCSLFVILFPFSFHLLLSF